MNTFTNTIPVTGNADDMMLKDARAEIENHRRMMIGTTPPDIRAMTLITGIPRLDEALATGPGDGGIIVVCGPTGGGKTVLAVQMAVNSALAGRTVWALMNDDTDPLNFYQRTYSAACDEPYERLQDLGFKDIGTGNIRLPVLPDAGLEFSARALNLGKALRGRMRLGFRPDLHDDPHRGIRTFIETGTGMPDILIVDWLDAAFDRGADRDDRHDRINASMRYLRRLVDHGVLVVVFCQARPQVAGTCRNVWKTAVAEFPQIAAHADRFVGISRLRAIPEDGNGSFSANQFLTVYPDARADTFLTIPVSADFGFQRFLAREEDHADRHALLAQHGLRIRVASQHAGWVRFDRRWLMNVAELGHPPSINVFTLLLLMAGPRTRECFPGRGEIARATGLSDKQVRVAMDKLKAGGFIHDTGRKRNRALVWSVDPAAKDDRNKDDGFWFRLYRGLRDDNHKGLFAKPALLRVWLLCLTSARYKADPGMEVERGSFIVDPARLAGSMGIAVPEFVEGLAELETQGRIALAPSPEYPGIRVARIVNWELYQDGWIEGHASPGRCDAENEESDDDGNDHREARIQA